MSTKLTLSVLYCLLLVSIVPLYPAITDAESSYPVAWGVPRADGLQAGLRLVLPPGNRNIKELVAVGSIPLQFEVLVRNVSDKPVDIEFVQPDSYAYTEGAVITAHHTALDGKDKMRLTLMPLKPQRLGDLYIGHHRPKSNSAVDPRPFWSDSGTGLRHFGAVNVLAESSDKKQSLDTGFVDVTLRP